MFFRLFSTFSRPLLGPPSWLILALSSIVFASSSANAKTCTEVFAKASFEKEISHRDFERRVSRLSSQVKDPEAGFFGPQSMFWKVWREEVLSLRSASSVALQIAHPAIAHAISLRPEGIQEPIKRFEATTTVLGNLIFGDMQTALTTARRMHRLHSRFKGQTPENGRYHANNAELTYWVWATLIEGSLQAYQRFVQPLSAKELKKYYEESKILVQLSGIPESTIPKDYAAFQKYYDKQVEKLVVTENAQVIFDYLVSKEGIGRFISEKTSTILQPAGMHYAPRVAAAMLPHSVAKQFSIESSPSLDLFLSSLPYVVSITPQKLRFRKYYHDAMKRLEE